MHGLNCKKKDISRVLWSESIGLSTELIEAAFSPGIYLDSLRLNRTLYLLLLRLEVRLHGDCISEPWQNTVYTLVVDVISSFNERSNHRGGLYLDICTNENQNYVLRLIAAHVLVSRRN